MFTAGSAAVAAAESAVESDVELAVESDVESAVESDAESAVEAAVESVVEAAVESAVEAAGAAIEALRSYGRVGEEGVKSIIKVAFTLGPSRNHSALIQLHLTTGNQNSDPLPINIENAAL